jgi:UDP-N-acetylmuramoyl-tripeptide--D-alanyl-D-alanine ligase
MMFAALSGARSDGHDFVTGAIETGAVAALVSNSVHLPDTAGFVQLVVDDVLHALGTLACAWHRQIRPRTVGITGSNGKTTTRDMVANILARNARVLATSGNFNNELGLPLTLFQLDSKHEFAVLELGASKSGDIRYLAEISAPGVGLVTNVSRAHLQGFGDEEGVARAKGELYEALPVDGFAVINADEPWAGLWLEMCASKNVITFGRENKSDVTLVRDERGQSVKTPDGSFTLQLSLPGDHNLQNALAATAVALTLDIPLEQIREGLESTRAVPGRLNLVYTMPGWTVIDDTYNANPASLYAALQVLSLERGEPWLVLGDMKELGHGSKKMHAEMGEAARALGVKRLFAVGEASVFTVDAFGSGGSHFPDHSSLIDQLCSELRPAVVCLVKGSRSMGMEKVVQAISEPVGMREAG